VQTSAASTAAGSREQVSNLALFFSIQFSVRQQTWQAAAAQPEQRQFQQAHKMLGKISSNYFCCTCVSAWLFCRSQQAHACVGKSMVQHR